MDTIRHLDSLRCREHEATVELIGALIACAENEDHVAAGYASIWALLVERLRYSPAAASRRHAAVKIARRWPVALDMLREHRTSLTCLAKVAHLLRAEDFEDLLRAIDGASADEVDRVVVARRPRPKPRERVRRAVVKFESPRPAASSAAEVKTLFDGPDAPPARTPRSNPRTEERIQLSFSVTASDYDRFQRARAKASRKHGPGVSIEAIFVEMLAKYVDEATSSERRPKPPANRNRHIPAATRRTVFRRDDARCRFVGPDGHRCSATLDLQIDHVVPYARGGSHDATNLRLLCGKHNRWRSKE